jgi:phytoene synthase
LWDLDLAFADVISSSSDPRLGAIRLAWWREQLQQLDDPEAPPPAEPRLQAAARELVSRGISGQSLSFLEDAWEPLLEPFPWDSLRAGAFRLRGRLLFGFAARLMGADEKDADHAGALWSLHDGATHCSDSPSRAMLEAAAREQLPYLPNKVERRFRPISVLAALAAHDLLKGPRGRGKAALAHRLFGTFPR